MKIAILNGPNLNRLGIRKPEIYGTRTMAQILIEIQRKWQDVHFVYRQSNHEGDLIDWIQNLTPSCSTDSHRQSDRAELFTPSKEGDEPVQGIVLNAGGYSHTSVALRDAVEECEVPVVEVHISDISQREPFRRTSLLTDVCAHSIIGKGTNGYQLGVEWLLNTLKG